MSNGRVETFVQETCISCGGGSSVIHSGIEDRIFGVSGRWGTRRCINSRCGLAWIDPTPVPADIHKLYHSYWTHGQASDEPPAPDAALSSSRKRAVRTALGYAFPWRWHALRSDSRYLEGMTPGKLLDVGCGMGEFAAGMAKLGWEAHGIDFDAAAVKMAARQPGVSVSVGALTDMNFPAASFDAVTLSNVIEHIADPAATFAECHRILRKGGRLIMVTPNIDSLGHQVFGPDWRGLEVPRHLYLYTTDALKRFAQAAGFPVYRSFTSPGAVEEMFHASDEIAEKNGRDKHGNLGALARREKIEVMLGRRCGEWVVLWAEK